MKPVRKKRLQTVLLILVTSALGSFLIIRALDSNLDFFYTPSEIFLEEIPENKRIKIHLTEIIHNHSTSPDLKTDNKSYLHVPTGEGLISILRLQIEGKNPITISQFLLGNKITKFHRFL